MQNVKNVRVRDEGDLVRLAALLGGCVFRGHAESQWPLRSSLERICDAFDVEPAARAEREMNALREFKRRAHDYLPSSPGQSESELLDWLALLQHYGGPTRLLDVTHSLFIGTFFAVEEARQDAAVWAFNSGSLTSSGEPEGPRQPSSATLGRANRVLRSGTGTGGVLLVKPFRLNRRLADQQGAFLMPMDLGQSLASQLASTLDVDLDSYEDAPAGSWDSLGIAPAVRIVVIQDCHSRLLRFLSKANVSATTLFAGLDGLGRFLRTTFRLFD